MADNIACSLGSGLSHIVLHSSSWMRIKRRGKCTEIFGGGLMFRPRSGNEAELPHCANTRYYYFFIPRIILGPRFLDQQEI